MRYTLQMHSNDCLTSVLTSMEAATIWGLSRNAISDACRRGALPARKSGQTWLVTVADMLNYQKGRYWPDNVPAELQSAFDEALARRQE